MDKIKGLVAYCDGGANPNPNGPSGSGVHAYVYRYAVEGEKPSRFDSWFATDEGYVLKKDFEGGNCRGVIVERVIEMVDAIGLSTNNVAEMNAVRFVLDYVVKNEGYSKVHIICDSQYTLRGMNEWVPGWKRNNWRKGDGLPPANVDLWMAIDKLFIAASEKLEVTSGWVRGHDENFGNCKSDYLASIAVNRSYIGNQGLEVREFDAVDYYKKRDGIHPFISLNRFYFNTNPEFHRPGVYYMTDGSGKEFITGKRSSEATYAVVCTASPVDVVEKAIVATTSRETEFSRIVYGKIERFRNQDVLLFADNWGMDSFIRDRRNLNINSVDRKPAVVEVRADELPLRIFDGLAFLEDVLVEFQSNYLVNNEFFEGHARGFRLFDVTDHFYTTRTKKSGKSEIEVHELKKEFGVGCRNTRIKIPYQIGKVDELDLIFSFEEDIPPRNSFKHFELINPAVYAVVWKDSDHLVRYATIVKTDDAVGVWSNFFANNYLLK